MTKRNAENIIYEVGDVEYSAMTGNIKMTVVLRPEAIELIKNNTFNPNANPAEVAGAVREMLYRITYMDYYRGGMARMDVVENGE